MSLAIFDLDHTLIAEDSDYLWGQFLVEHGMVDAQYYAQENQRYYDDYQAGTLDVHAFLAFSLHPLSLLDPATLARLHDQFMTEKIAPVMLPAAQALLDWHRQCGNELLIITATNRFVTAPIAAALDVPNLLATEPEQIDDRYTGQVSGIPCFQEGKVVRLQAWLTDTGHDLAGSHFYSDSHNDLPLLERVDHPVAIDPDPGLDEVARARDWPRLTLRQGPVPQPLT